MPIQIKIFFVFALVSLKKSVEQKIIEEAHNFFNSLLLSYEMKQFGDGV